METKTIPALSFCAFAAMSLARWRALEGQSVSARDARWGLGHVVDVRWEGRSDRPDDEGRIYVRVEYASGLQARVDARALARLHRDVTIEAALADFVEKAYAAQRAPRQGAAVTQALAQWDRVLQARWDDERRLRADALRQRARERENVDASA